MRSDSSAVNAILALAFLIAAGVSGYVLIERASLLDALYMTVTTLSTVGYREVVPLTTAGKIFTMLLIVCGLGVVFYGTSLVAGDVIEGRLRLVLGRRRVQRRIEQLSAHYIVCGFGRMGRIVCNELAAKPVPFVVVERQPEAIRELQQRQYLYVDGDATEDDALVAAGIARATGLVTALSKDSDNVYVVLTARQLKPDLLIVARAEDERSEPKLMQAGATRVVSPYLIGGSRMAGALLRPAVLDVLDLATHYRSMELKIEEFPVSARGAAAGEIVRAADLGADLGLIVIAVKRADGEMLFNPDPEVRLDGGDRLVVMGQTASLNELERRLGRPSEP
jgi:voltage-gated potassium channel